MEINRRLGDPAYAPTRAVDEWLRRLLAARSYSPSEPDGEKTAEPAAAPAAAPANWAAIKPATLCGAIPENVSVKHRAKVIAGLAKLVEEVNQ